MSEPIQIHQTGAPRSPGAKVLGIILGVIGFIFMLAVVFPFVGTFIAFFGLAITFVGIGLYAYGSKTRRND